MNRDRLTNLPGPDKRELKDRAKQYGNGVSKDGEKVLDGSSRRCRKLAVVVVRQLAFCGVHGPCPGPRSRITLPTGRSMRMREKASSIPSCARAVPVVQK